MTRNLSARFRRALEAALQRRPHDGPDEILSDCAQQSPDLWTEVAQALANQEGRKRIARFRKITPSGFSDEVRQLRLFE